MKTICPINYVKYIVVAVLVILFSQPSSVFAQSEYLSKYQAGISVTIGAHREFNPEPREPEITTKSGTISLSVAGRFDIGVSSTDVTDGELAKGSFSFAYHSPRGRRRNQSGSAIVISSTFDGKSYGAGGYMYKRFVLSNSEIILPFVGVMLYRSEINNRYGNRFEGQSSFSLSPSLGVGFGVHPNKNLYMIITPSLSMAADSHTFVGLSVSVIGAWSAGARSLPAERDDAEEVTGSFDEF